mmetsp:Transcript_120937/g.386312  ORF Transcript_120937/g.386312 Transcript_120937/m.386312 type:complete len:439 (+) Transcript_120937:146-1462(+)
MADCNHKHMLALTPPRARRGSLPKPAPSATWRRTRGRCVSAICSCCCQCFEMRLSIGDVGHKSVSFLRVCCIKARHLLLRLLLLVLLRRLLLLLLGSRLRPTLLCGGPLQLRLRPFSLIATAAAAAAAGNRGGGVWGHGDGHRAALRLARLCDLRCARLDHSDWLRHTWILVLGQCRPRQSAQDGVRLARGLWATGRHLEQQKHGHLPLPASLAGRDDVVVGPGVRRKAIRVEQRKSGESLLPSISPLARIDRGAICSQARLHLRPPQLGEQSQSKRPLLGLGAGAERDAVRHDVGSGTLLLHPAEKGKNQLPLMGALARSHDSAEGHLVGRDAVCPHAPQHRERLLPLLVAVARLDRRGVSDNVRRQADALHPGQHGQRGGPLPALGEGADGGAVGDLVGLDAVARHVVEEHQRPLPLARACAGAHRGAIGDHRGLQ